MEEGNIRDELHEYINNGDEKLLKIMYAVAKEYNESDDFEFSAEEITELEERKRKRLNGESKVYSWEEAKKFITGERNLNEL